MTAGRQAGAAAPLLRDLPSRTSLDALSAPEREQLLLDQLIFTNDFYRSSSVALPIFAIAIGAMLTAWHPLNAVLPWALYLIAISFGGQLVNRRFLARPRTADDLKLWIPLSVCVRLGPMLGIAALPFLFWTPGEPANHMFITIVLAACIGAASSVPAGCWPIFLANFAPCALAAAAGPLMEGQPVYAGLAALTGIYSLYLFRMAVVVHRAIRSMLMLRTAKNALIDKLEHASAAKSLFLANMSHELRTPLNAILGFSEVMKDEVLGPVGSPNYKAYAADIHASGAHLLGLINDILDLAKIESGKFELNDEPIDLDEFFRDVLRIFRVQAERADVALAADIEPGLMLMADRRAARQIALNLVSNAIKFTPPGGRVTMFARTLPEGGFETGVSDTGFGIAPEDQARLFDAFAQGRHDIRVAEKGTGLGLAIVKGLAELHGGGVRLQSALGKGTTVTVHGPGTRVVRKAGSGAQAA